MWNHQGLPRLLAVKPQTLCKGLQKVLSQLHPTLGPADLPRTKLNTFYCTAGANWKGRAAQNTRKIPRCKHGNGSWETEKLFKIAPWFIRNNSKVDTSPTFHPTRGFITGTREMQALRNRIPSPTFLPHKASRWVLSVTSATAWIAGELDRVIYHSLLHFSQNIPSRWYYDIKEEGEGNKM